MIILIPFYLLRLRRTLTQSRSEVNKKALKSLIENDIVNSIRINLELGNISAEDGHMLFNLIQKLYRNIYADYDELEDITMMIDESLDLPIDRLYAQVEKLEIALEEKESVITKKNDIINQKNSTINEQNSTINSLTAENEALKKQLEELKKTNSNT